MWQSLLPMRRATRSQDRPAPIVQLKDIPAWPQTYANLKAERGEGPVEESSATAGKGGQQQQQQQQIDPEGTRPEQKSPPAQAESKDSDTMADVEPAVEEASSAAARPTKTAAAAAAASAAAAAAAGEPAQPAYAVNPALNSKIRLFRGDITKLQVDAIVNAANSGLWAGGGICGAIFDAAGERRLQRACDRWIDEHGKVPPGQTRLTRGFALPAPFILHTVGPMDEDEEDLVAAYRSTLDACVNPVLLDQKQDEEVRIRSVALCCISTGIYGFDNAAACEVALRTTREWLEEDPSRAEHMDAIVFVVFLPKDLRLYEHFLPVYFPVEASAATAHGKQTKGKAKQQGRPNQRPSPTPASPTPRVEHVRASAAVKLPTKSGQRNGGGRSPSKQMAASPAPRASHAATSRAPNPSSTSVSFDVADPFSNSPSLSPAPPSAPPSAAADARLPMSSLSSLSSPPMWKKRKSEEEAGSAEAKEADSTGSQQAPSTHSGEQATVQEARDVDRTEPAGEVVVAAASTHKKLKV